MSAHDAPSPLYKTLKTDADLKSGKLLPPPFPGSITLAFPQNTPPFFFLDDKTKKPDGLIYDFWELWSSKTGVKIEYRPGTWEETINWIKSNRVDAHAGLLYSKKRAQFINYIYPLTDTSIAVFFHTSVSGIDAIQDLKGLVVGVIKGSYSEFFLKQSLPNVSIITYANEEDLFEAARQKTIRAFSRSMENTQWEMSNTGLGNQYKTHPNLILNRRDIIAGASPSKPSVATAIREGMNLISPSERKQIEKKWKNAQKDKTDAILTIAMHHNMPPLTFMDRENRPVGLLVDIWRLWSAKTGTKIKFIPSPWTDTLKNVKNGTVDAHAGLYFSEQRAGWLIFSQAFYESDASIFYPSVNGAISHIEQLKGKKVGVVQKTFHESYLKKNYPELICVPYPTTLDMVNAIEKKEIDAFFAVPYLTSRILTSMGLNGKYTRMDERHGRQKFRAGVLKKNREILKKIDAGLGRITHDELVAVEERWIPDPKERVFNRQEKEIRLTGIEENWLKEHPVWKAGIPIQDEPYTISARNGDKGTGIVFDYLKILSERLAIHFKTEMLPAEPDNRLSETSLDLFFGVNLRDYPGMHLSDKVYTLPHVIVNRVDAPLASGINELNGKSVAAVKNSVEFNHLLSAFPNIAVLSAENTLDALYLTSTGKTAATVCDLNIAGRLIAEKRLANLKIAAPFQSPEVLLRFRVKNSSPALSLLNKAIHSITPEEHKRIHQKWNPVFYEKGPDWQVITRWAIGIGSVFILIVTIILVWNHRLSLEVNERKKAEAALKGSEERYRGIFEFTKNGVAVFHVMNAGRDFVLTELNHSAEKIEKINKKEVIGKQLTEVFPGFEDIGLSQLFRKVFETGTAEGHPVSFYQDDRISGWREYFVYKLPTDEMVMVYSDESGRKTAEAEKERLTAQLHQAQKMETIGTLAGGVAHDFNNILGIILGNIELAEEDIFIRNLVLDRLKDAQKACIRAKEVVRQLLLFSRGTEDVKEPLRLNVLIRESLKMLRSLLPATIEIQMDIQTDQALILGNRTQIHQILLNLCTNAAQAMEPEGGRLTIELADVVFEKKIVSSFNKLPAGRYARLRIMDTGIGLAPDSKDRIFDPYFTTKEVGKGTGMGLAIVSGAVRNHQGAISVDSQPGQGTIFEILLPFINSKAQVIEPVSEKKAGGTERILVVDDEPMIAQLEKNILEHRGYCVTAVGNPLEALALFTQEPGRFDLVITDMTMPKMKGDQLAMKILAIRPQMPIILCSGFSEKMDEEQALKIGIRRYIEKPVETKQLTRIVRQVLDQAN